MKELSHVPTNRGASNGVGVSARSVENDIQSFTEIGRGG